MKFYKVNENIMLENLLIYAFVVASLSILWRSTLNKIPNSREKIKEKLPFPFGTAITCGLCFTYWVAFFVVLVFNPFSGENFFYEDIGIIATFFLSWMMLGLPSVFIRFLFALLQEKVNEMNEINGHGHHHSHNH